MKFNIPKPQLPTEEELKKDAQNFWETIYPVSFLAWNNELAKNAYPFCVIKMPESMAKSMADEVWEGKNSEAFKKELGDFIEAARVEVGLDDMFVKLISRSPKDWMDADEFGKPSPFKTGQEAAKAFMSSMRIFDDMCMFVHIPEKCYIVVRPYYLFPASNEFRVLIKDGSIVGISQYYYTKDFYYEEIFLARTDLCIRAFIDSIVTPNMKIGSFVADVVVSNDGGNCTLLETNPYGISDPCLFRSYENLDGSFRVNKTAVDVMADTR